MVRGVQTQTRPGRGRRDEERGGGTGGEQRETPQTGRDEGRTGVEPSETRPKASGQSRKTHRRSGHVRSSRSTR